MSFVQGPSGSGTADLSKEPRTISADKTIPADTSEITVGPVTIEAGVTVTFADAESKWQILTGGVDAYAGTFTQAFQNISSDGPVFMVGLAAPITPVRSGRVFVAMSGNIHSSGVTSKIASSLQIRYGTGTAPVASSDATGTVLGYSVNYLTADGGGVELDLGFSLVGFITDLMTNVAYWFDIGKASSAVGSLENVAVCLIEV